jgi:hypothetical protein
LGIGSAPSIAQIVQKQLADYRYTFPTALHVSCYFHLDACKLKICQNVHPDGVPMRTRPYRNSRIIQVIRDLYFTGGGNAFVNRFGNRFPTFQGDDGVVVREVPIAMVALVATAVSL